MIITRAKDPEEIREMIGEFQRIAVIGCGLCATTCQTGGADEVKEMVSFLSREGKEVIWTKIVDGVCLKLLLRRDLAGQSRPDAYLVMACGSGAQTAAGLMEERVLPALDSLYLGSVLQAGLFEKKCAMCGSCLVHRFEGLCPVTLCAKSMLNGPCGGMEDGKCETDPERECVWHKIFLMKEEEGRLGDLEEIVSPQSCQVNSSK